ncbi:hypothetical protein CEXT_245711 [Caerostris extrusa]|uniref:Uncharacterized protein n=1 Tax=Caerostris extrusa TaxID=172846 RepID=A0AAV4NF77_CAEEX|nr:hypothetical protein CEXT_245711 [Caerostris extrusa]
MFSLNLTADYAHHIITTSMIEAGNLSKLDLESLNSVMYFISLVFLIHLACQCNSFSRGDLSKLKAENIFRSPCNGLNPYKAINDFFAFTPNVWMGLQNCKKPPCHEFE